MREAFIKESQQDGGWWGRKKGEMKREDEALFRAALLKEGVAGGFRKKKKSSWAGSGVRVTSFPVSQEQGAWEFSRIPHTNMSARAQIDAEAELKMNLISPRYIRRLKLLKLLAGSCWTQQHLAAIDSKIFPSGGVGDLKQI